LGPRHHMALQNAKYGTFRPTGIIGDDEEDNGSGSGGFDPAANDPDSVIPD
jgi:hypothetical protein